MATRTRPRAIIQVAPEISVGHRLQGIDVMRGLAVILVVLSHIHLRFKINHYEVADLLPHPLIAVLFQSGHYSVMAFFVISGFLILSLSLRRWGTLDRIPPLLFYRLRAARIMPCLLLLLAVLSVLHLAGVPDFVIKSERASLGRALVSALTFHLNWLEGQRGYLPGNWDVLWSLSVEEAFYALFPLVCLVMRRERWVLVCMAALIVIGPLNRIALQGQDPWVSKANFSCMDGIAFGCIAAWIAARVHLSRTLLRGAMVLGVSAVMLIVVFRKQSIDLGLMKVSLDKTILELGVALVLVALSRGVGNAILSKGTGLLRLAGRCSYEIYLTHMFVIFALMHSFKALYGGMPSTQAFFVTYAIMLTLSVLLGYIVERWFSDPLNRALRDKHDRRPSRLVESAIDARCETP